jgi:hypothetical protein
MSFLDRIRACNRWDPRQFVPFRVDGEKVGLIRRDFVPHLRGWPTIMGLREEGVDWVNPATDLEDRSRVLHELLVELHAQGVIGPIHGERYPVSARDRLQPRLLIDRSAAPYFGVRAYGQHLNGFVRAREGLKLWVARRAPDRRVYPNHLDNLAAGGLPWGLGLTENIRKECWEEAGIPAALAARAVAVGAVTYCVEGKHGLKPDVMYCYDLEVPADFQPVNTDGEVAGFELQTMEQVMARVRDTDEFKLNCNLVIIDFLIRHGLIGPDEPDYLDLVQGLRSPLP